MKTIDVMPGDTWTTWRGLFQYRNGQYRAIHIDAPARWVHAGRSVDEIDCDPDVATKIILAYGYTINHAQPEAKPVRVTHGVMASRSGAIIVLGSEDACKLHCGNSESCSVVPLAFGPESA